MAARLVELLDEAKRFADAELSPNNPGPRGIEWALLFQGYVAAALVEAVDLCRQEAAADKGFPP